MIRLIVDMTNRHNFTNFNFFLFNFDGTSNKTGSGKCSGVKEKVVKLCNKVNHRYVKIVPKYIDKEFVLGYITVLDIACLFFPLSHLCFCNISL